MPWTTEPLTETERADFRRRFEARLAKVKAKVHRRPASLHRRARGRLVLR
jgi:hypothetical protein